MGALLAPPVAFLIYLVLVAILFGIGKVLAGVEHGSVAKSTTYGSGEAPPMSFAAPGYRPFMIVALFFAVIHLGILVLGSSGLTPLSAVYLGGLILALMALILG
jgi:NADH:ubiquinone oxidoreductase subunit 3 (subunit A)